MVDSVPNDITDVNPFYGEVSKNSPSVKHFGSVFLVLQFVYVLSLLMKTHFDYAQVAPELDYG